jgi:hypothetical protein
MLCTQPSGTSPLARLNVSMTSAAGLRSRPLDLGEASQTLPGNPRPSVGSGPLFSSLFVAAKVED